MSQLCVYCMCQLHVSIAYVSCVFQLQACCMAQFAVQKM
jgi:hypothetical protein